MSPIFQIAIDAMKLVPLRKPGETTDDWHSRVVGWQRQFGQWTIEPYAGALVRAAAMRFEVLPESEKLRLTDVSVSGASRADKNAYQRDLMRKRRAAAKAAREANANEEPTP
jgi:hypothetical protein